MGAHFGCILHFQIHGENNTPSHPSVSIEWRGSAGASSIFGGRLGFCQRHTRDRLFVLLQWRTSACLDVAYLGKGDFE